MESVTQVQILGEAVNVSFRTIAFEWTHIFSLQLWVNSWEDWSLKPDKAISQVERKLWIQMIFTPLKIGPVLQLTCGSRGG